jgi:hypothetical protein
MKWARVVEKDFVVSIREAGQVPNAPNCRGPGRGPVLAFLFLVLSELYTLLTRHV